MGLGAGEWVGRHSPVVGMDGLGPSFLVAVAGRVRRIASQHRRSMASCCSYLGVVLNTPNARL
jgi:hypothetical protein